MRIDRVKLITEMARQDLTVKALAEKSFVSRGTISNIKCGKTCSVLVGNAIAKALGVDVLDITEDSKGD
ncbi:MAG: helix-turn-helix transcriptional regulator [Clostridiales bacterium]|nr:helix-turn-helix transcriptional regulator [Clostridiales bacterium]